MINLIRGRGRMDGGWMGHKWCMYVEYGEG